MYGKLFSQMYDGTLATHGPWQALVTFQQLIILADKDGVVDMTPESISRRTTIPLDIVRLGLTSLEAPDEESRTPDMEGRRIVRLSESRTWGWQIVNHAHYRKLRSQDERRDYMRTYQQKRRAKDVVNTNVNSVSNVNQSSKQYAVCKKQESKPSRTPPNGECSPVGFDAFWSAYPKRRAKPAAIDAWRKLDPDPALAGQIAEAAKKWAATDDWRRDAGKYVVYPAKWLKQRGWEDELPALARAWPANED